MAKEPVVYQANPLIEGRREFSLVETRLFYIGLKDLTPHLTKKDHVWLGGELGEHTNFPTTTISTKELVQLFGSDSYYSTLEGICNDMARKTIQVKDADGNGYDIYPVFNKISYRKNTGLTLRFNPDMKPWLLDLANKPFTKLPFEQIWGLGSPYAVRLLELLLQYQNTKTHERTLTVDEIRNCLAVPENAYKGRMNNFRQFIIDKPVREVNEKTKYKIDYEPVKEGRKIVAFKFKLHLPEEIVKEERRKQIAKLGEIKTAVSETLYISSDSRKEDGYQINKMTDEQAEKGKEKVAEIRARLGGTK